MMAEEKLHRKPFLALLGSSRKKLLQAFLLTAVTSSIISLFLYLPTYLSTIIKIQTSHSYLINLISFLSFALMTAFFGRYSDKVNREKLVVLGASLLIVFSYPLFNGLATFGEPFIWIFTLGFSLFGAMINGSYVVLIAESFPAHSRYSGVGFSYSLGVALFGGTAPLVFTGLINYLNFVEAPSLYLSGCAVLTLFAALSYQLDKRQTAFDSSSDVVNV